MISIPKNEAEQKTSQKLTPRQIKAAEKKAGIARRAQLRAEGVAVVATQKCPCCGQGIRYNNAITGWYQCAGYGAEGFRAKDSKPCSWQVIIPRED